MNEVFLRLPLRSEFVLIARLSASGYVARLGIDIEKAEDIKVTISEILNMCIISSDQDNYLVDIKFNSSDKELNIDFKTKNLKNLIESGDPNGMGNAIIQTLCDGFGFISDDELLVKFEIKENK